MERGNKERRERRGRRREEWENLKMSSSMERRTPKRSLKPTVCAFKKNSMGLRSPTNKIQVLLALFAEGRLNTFSQENGDEHMMNTVGMKGRGTESEEDEHNSVDVRISQFFTRNKSLSFLLSQEEAPRPHKKAINASMALEANLEREEDSTANLPRTAKSKSVLGKEDKLGEVEMFRK